jgi:hypothetical protein
MLERVTQLHDRMCYEIARRSIYLKVLRLRSAIPGDLFLSDILIFIH